MVGAQIHAERHAREMGQDVLSRRTEVAVSTISRIERGRTVIDITQLERIAEVFEITPEELIRRARLSGITAAARIYRPDGSLDGDIIRNVPASDDEVLNAVEAQRADDDGEQSDAR